MLKPLLELLAGDNACSSDDNAVFELVVELDSDEVADDEPRACKNASMFAAAVVEVEAGEDVDAAVDGLLDRKSVV